MTDGISARQFNIQVGPAKSLDGNVKLDSGGGLKTYGKSFLGKVACWFQKSTTRKAQSQNIRNSFIKALDKGYGDSKFVKDICKGLEGDTRLKLRTVKQTLDKLNTFKTKGESLMGAMLKGNNINDIKKQMKEMSPTMKSSTISYIIKNAPINTVKDAVNLLNEIGKLSSTDSDQAVTRVFDKLIKEEGGLQKLRDCTKELISMEIKDAKQAGTLQKGNLLRSDTPATKMTKKVLIHMNKEQNQALTDKLIQLDPKKFPSPKLPNPNFDPNKPDERDTNPKEIDNPEFIKLRDNMAKTCLNQIKGQWANGISNETKTFFNGIKETVDKFKSDLGGGVGEKVAGAMMFLRLLSPVTFRMNTMKAMALETNELKKSIKPELKPEELKEINSKIESLKGKRQAILDVSKGIQFLANGIGTDNYTRYLSKSVETKQPNLIQFVKDNQKGIEELVKNVCTLPLPKKDEI